MIFEINSETHPKVKILFIDYRKNTVDFQWLDEEEKALEIYTGDCMVACAITSPETMESEIVAAIEDVLE